MLADGTNTYLYGMGRIGEQGADWAYHLPDALGSVRQLADAAGAASYAQGFEPYGEMLTAGGSQQSGYGFAGEWTDATGLQYLRARYYAPEVGRFISSDPFNGQVINPQSLNNYGYAFSNPINQTDPSGKSPLSECNGQFNAANCNQGQWSTKRFRLAIDYIYNEMTTNAQSRDTEVIRTLIAKDSECLDFSLFLSGPQGLGQAGGPLGGMALFALKVRPGGPWDHKPILRRLLDISSGDPYDEFFPIEGINAFEVHYDIWSNIHYGYVGASIGFDRRTLQDAAASALAGGQDFGDIISVDIGIRLWNTKAGRMTNNDIHQAILGNLDEYFMLQDRNHNGHIDEDEVLRLKPYHGKLYPRGFEFSDGR